MADLSNVERILCEHLKNPNSSFSVGSFGANAEFHRDTGENLTLAAFDRLTVATGRGAFRVILHDQIVPVAYETLSKRPGHWQHGIVFCLPASRGASNIRPTVTELGPDRHAIRKRDRDAILFDMGLGARNVDFCVRTTDQALIDLLRRHLGQSLLAPGSRVMAAIVEASPHRIAISRLGRIEVYQAIGRVKTPDGPHTHVLPKFLKSRRTHSANIPIPAGYLPCLSIYPPNPLRSVNGDRKSFCASEHAAFQALLAAWGSPDYCHEKQRVTRAVQNGMPATSYDPHDSRLGRTAIRIALRQMRLANPNDPSALTPWFERFDRVRTRT